MRKVKKTLAVVMAMALSVTAFAGCGKKDDSSKTKDSSSSKVAKEVVTPAADTGKVLNVYCWNDEFKSRFEAYYAPDKQDQLKGIKVEFHIYPNQGGVYQQKLDEALKKQNKAAADEKIDMFLIEADYALKYANSPVAVPLNLLGIKDEELANQYDYTKDVVTDKDGLQRATTWQACPGLFTYRRSIAKDVLGTDDPNEVQKMLADWTKFDEVAQKMKDKGYYMVSGYDDAFRIFSNNITDKMVKDGTFKIAPELMQWVDQTKTYTDKGFNEKTSLWNGEWTAGMGPNGKVFGYFWSTWGINFSLAGASLADKNKPSAVGNGTFGDWAACYGPQSYFWGGSWVCAATGSDNLNLVADIMRKMTMDSTTMKKITLDTQDMTNNKPAMQEIAADTKYQAAILGGQNHIALFTNAADKIVMKYTSAYDQGIAEEFQGAMIDYFVGNISKEEALDNFYSNLAVRYPGLKIER